MRNYVRIENESLHQRLEQAYRAIELLATPHQKEMYSVSIGSYYAECDGIQFTGKKFDVRWLIADLLEMDQIKTEKDKLALLYAKLGIQEEEVKSE